MSHVALVGNLSEGYVAFGPYENFDDAATNHPGPDVWIVEMKKPEPARRARLLTRLKKHASEEELDETIHMLVSQQASSINNGGLDAQFEYMEKHCGLDWIDERFTWSKKP